MNIRKLAILYFLLSTVLYFSFFMRWDEDISKEYERVQVVDRSELIAADHRKTHRILRLKTKESEGIPVNFVFMAADEGLVVYLKIGSSIFSDVYQIRFHSDVGEVAKNVELHNMRDILNEESRTRRNILELSRKLNVLNFKLLPELEFFRKVYVDFALIGFETLPEYIYAMVSNRRSSDAIFYFPLVCSDYDGLKDVSRMDINFSGKNYRYLISDHEKELLSELLECGAPYEK